MLLTNSYRMPELGSSPPNFNVVFERTWLFAENRTETVHEYPYSELSV